MGEPLLSIVGPMGGLNREAMGSVGGRRPGGSVGVVGPGWVRAPKISNGCPEHMFTDKCKETCAIFNPFSRCQPICTDIHQILSSDTMQLMMLLSPSCSI